jgi:hypothetical protein
VCGERGVLRAVDPDDDAAGRVVLVHVATSREPEAADAVRPAVRSTIARGSGAEKPRAAGDTRII